MRVDRFICNATGMSRNQVQRLIKDGAVKINGIVATKSNEHLEPNHTITIDEKPVSLPEPIYLKLHKPSGYVCANEDGEHPIVLDLIGDAAIAKHPTDPLQIVGRLDLDTTGLVLLTTDGKWNHAITSPNGMCAKTYQVHLANPLNHQQKAQLENGIVLNGEKKPTRPATVIIKRDRIVQITIHEGKYHQVKRMFTAVGNHVLQLLRLQIGEIKLDADLKEGEFRSLTQDEIQSVFRFGNKNTTHLSP